MSRYYMNYIVIEELKSSNGWIPISKNLCFLSIVSIKDNAMQNVVIFDRVWVSISLYSLTRGIVAARLISMKFGTD